MRKNDAISLLGGTPKKAAEAMGYRSVHAVYQWPDVLPQATADRVRGVLVRATERAAIVANKAPVDIQGVCMLDLSIQALRAKLFASQAALLDMQAAAMRCPLRRALLQAQSSLAFLRAEQAEDLLRSSTLQTSSLEVVNG